MSYRLKFDEPVHKGWRRIVGEQIETALEMLRSGEDVDKAIHETRKSMKRVRALLKLLRPGLSTRDFKRENKRFADIARLLSGVRDQAVLAATAAALSERTTGKARVAACSLAEEARTRSQGTAQAQGADEAQGHELAAATVSTSLAVAVAHDKAQRVRAAIAALEQAAKSLKKLKLKSRSFDVVRDGLERTYRDARRDMKLAYKSDIDEHFHEWRKSVQAHWRHMLLIDRAWPDVFTARADLAKEMSELLGEDHDLYVLIQTLAARSGDGAEAAGHDALGRAARVRQAEIRAELAAKGKALFAEPAARFVARVDRYWTAARAARKAARKSVAVSKERARTGGAEQPSSSTKKASRAGNGTAGTGKTSGKPSDKGGSVDVAGDAPANVTQPKPFDGGKLAPTTAKVASRLHAQAPAAMARPAAKRSASAAADATPASKAKVRGKARRSGDRSKA